MKNYTGTVTIFNGRYELDYRVNVQASSWPVAANRAVNQALRGYRKTRGRRVPAEKIALKLTAIKPIVFQEEPDEG